MDFNIATPSAPSLSDIINGVVGRPPQQQTIFGPQVPTIPGVPPSQQFPQLNLPSPEAPLVGHEAVAAALQGAMGKGQAPQEAKDMAIMKMGAAIAQPRNKYQQSQVGQILNAATGAMGDIQTANAEAKKQAVADAGLAMQAEAYSMNRDRTMKELALLDFNIQYAPKEKQAAYQKLRLEIDNAIATGKSAAVKLLMEQALQLAQPEKIAADLAESKAKTKRLGTEADLDSAHAYALRTNADTAKGKSDREAKGVLNVSKLNDTTELHTIFNPTTREVISVEKITVPDDMSVRSELAALKKGGMGKEELKKAEARLRAPQRELIKSSSSSETPTIAAQPAGSGAKQTSQAELEARYNGAPTAPLATSAAPVTDPTVSWQNKGPPRMGMVRPGEPGMVQDQIDLGTGQVRTVPASPLGGMSTPLPRVGI